MNEHNHGHKFLSHVISRWGGGVKPKFGLLGNAYSCVCSNINVNSGKERADYITNALPTKMTSRAELFS